MAQFRTDSQRKAAMARIKGGKRETIFFEPRFKGLAEKVSLRSPTAAKKSVRELRREFDKAKTDKKKLRIARATQLAANRAKVSVKRENLSSKERKQFRKIERIFDKEADKMFEDVKEGK